MTLVLGPLLANGEVVDPNESLDKENTIENNLFTSIITKGKKRRISQNNNDTTISTQNNVINNSVEKETIKKVQEQHTDHKSNNKKPLNHTEKHTTGAKPTVILTPKGGTVCNTFYIEVTRS